jgi:hypothetical protein
MVEKKDIKLTLKQLIDNEPVPINIPELGTFYVREPTRGDRIEARAEAMKQIQEWDKLSALEQMDEVTARVIVKCIVEPKITYEEFLKLPTRIEGLIIEQVSSFLTERTKIISNPKAMTDFLPQTKEEKA